ncbi:DUF3592 domain-containing protein [Chryseobacterium sp.]|uniref:DUF3592 domain-containing protein n=1 Tax=Chryseobacterium sp. TaxID=1871047 RepID=UPI0025C059BB|nr:DUF3592 domain-containing protein [Chryseobacterium sp.]MBV8325465.1 DUF3592 domain-containing protein [Chryseobacterium sp.]
MNKKSIKLKNKQVKSDNFWIVSFFLMFLLLFLGMGVGGVYYSYSKFSRNINLVSDGVKTEARITGYEESWSKDSDGNGSTRMYSPVITYYDSSNHSYTLHADYSSSSREWSNDVTVYFDKKDPSRAIRGGFWHLWFWPFIILCLSMIPLGIGLFILNYYIRSLLKTENRLY